jgi:hypothetical protein
MLVRLIPLRLVLVVMAVLLVIIALHLEQKGQIQSSVVLHLRVAEVGHLTKRGEHLLIVMAVLGAVEMAQLLPEQELLTKDVVAVPLFLVRPIQPEVGVALD